MGYDRRETGPTLVADIGGTNTRLGLADGVRLRAGSVRRYRNADYPSLAEALGTFLAAEASAPCSGASVAVAGPVTGGRADLTNVPWSIDTATIARGVGTERVALLNDLQAQGHALGHLPDDVLVPVRAGGVHAAGATRLAVGVGTGFNAAPVSETAHGRSVAASEAGHASLPVHTETEIRLARAIAAAHGFAGVEEVLSGRGLARVHAWLVPDAPVREPHDIVAGLDTGTDATAEEAARVFTGLLGTLAGDLALTHLPFGGVFLIGSVARALGPWLARLGFEARFRDKGRFSAFMDHFAVWVVADDDAALTGCAAFLDN